MKRTATTNNGEMQNAARSSGVGIAYMCLGVVCMVALDATVRWLLQSYSLLQVVFLRSTFSVVLIFSIALARGQLPGLATKRYGWHIARSLLMAGSMMSFFHALRHLPLADIMVYAFAAPLIVTALSKPVLGEAVGPWRLAAVVIGFIGVLVVLRPGSASVHPAAAFALFGVVLYAGLALSARLLSRTETTLSLSLYLFGVPWLISGIGSMGSWVVPSATDWALFVAAGVVGGLGIIFINGAYHRAAVALVAPFEYTALIWAAAAGYVVWGEVPDRQTWIGAAIIVASGLFILFRETVARPPSDLDIANFPLQEAVGLPADEGGPEPPARR